jgi:hypothetical protein
MVLVTIMAMGLLIYSLGEERLRKALAALKKALPNQIGRMTNRPTLRWIFQTLENIQMATPPGRSHRHDRYHQQSAYGHQFFPPGVRQYYGAEESGLAPN